MTSTKTSLALSAAIPALLVLMGLLVPTGLGCGSDNGNADAGPQLTTGIYTASDARNVVDNCHQNPNPLAGTQYLVVVDAGFVQFYGTTTATPVGVPPQPAQGQGTLSGGQATLNHDNDTTNGSCDYHLKVVNRITVTGNNAFTSAYERTETNHSGICPSDRPDGCTTTFNWDLTQ
jgi:hypothetical protein